MAGLYHPRPLPGNGDIGDRGVVNLRRSLIAQSGALRGRGGPTNFCNL